MQNLKVLSFSCLTLNLSHFLFWTWSLQFQWLEIVMNKHRLAAWVVKVCCLEKETVGYRQCYMHTRELCCSSLSNYWWNFASFWSLLDVNSVMLHAVMGYVSSFRGHWSIGSVCCLDGVFILFVSKFISWE